MCQAIPTNVTLMMNPLYSSAIVTNFPVVETLIFLNYAKSPIKYLMNNSGNQNHVW